MNPGEVRAACEGFLAQILGRINNGKDPVEFLVRVLGEELTETRQDLTQLVDNLRAQVAFDLDEKGRVLLGVGIGEGVEFEALSLFSDLVLGVTISMPNCSVRILSSKAGPTLR